MTIAPTDIPPIHAPPPPAADATLLWAILCQKVQATPQGLSLGLLLDRVYVQPERHEIVLTLKCGWHFVATWRRTDSACRLPVSFRQRVTLVTPSGFRERVAESEIALDGETRQVSSVARLDVVRLGGQGMHEFVVERGEADGWREVARVPLDVYLPDEAIGRGN